MLRRREVRDRRKSPVMTPLNTGLSGLKGVWQRRSAETAEGSQGRLSNSRPAGEAGTRQEAPEDPVSEAAAEVAAAAATEPETDPEQAPEVGEVTAGGGTEPPGGTTRAEGGPGECPAFHVMWNDN
jgi:hypothetical protein